MGANGISTSVGIKSDESEAVVTISTNTLVVSVISLFLSIIFIFFLYFYAKYYIGASSARRRDQLMLADGVPPSLGLTPAVLGSLPITLYIPSDFKYALECAICLSELTAGEEVRLLPKCSHGFHLECINMWFKLHTTCPVCRISVLADDSGKALRIETAVNGDQRLPESPSLPRDAQANRRLASQGVMSDSVDSSDRMVVISIPH